MESTQKQARMARRQAAARRRTHNVILAGAFLLVAILCFIINLAVKDKAFSDTENRGLAQKPAFSPAALADGSYFSGVNSWYNDQFFARDRWMSLSLRETRLLGRKESGGVYLGSNGRLYGKPETPDEAALTETLEAVNQFAAEHPDISMQMLLAPGAAAIVTEDLPKNAPVRDQLQDIEDVRARLSEQVRFLDAASALRAHAGEEIYYKTDHHWTSLGAYYVFTATAADLGVTPAANYDIYTVATDFEGTLASKSGSHAVKDSVEIYAPETEVRYYLTKGSDTEKLSSIYSSEALEAKDKYTVFFGGNYDIIDIHTTADNGRILLVFKDSYANSFMQFLVPDYERIVMIDPRYYYGTLDSVMNYGITDVLFLYSADTLLTDTSLKDVLTARSAQAMEPEQAEPAAQEPEPSPSPSPETETAPEPSPEETGETPEETPET